MVKNCRVDAAFSSGEIKIADLSSRELAILGLIADGWSNRAIEQRLSIGSKTLEAACRSMYRKLHLDDTPEVNRRVLATRQYTSARERVSGHDFDIPDVRFVGRQQELEELDVVVQTKRLVTVTGSGGMGKTTLALALARQRAAQGRDVVFVDLVPSTSRSDVMQAIAEAFRLPVEDHTEIIRRIRRRCADPDCFLLIDNADGVGNDLDWIISSLGWPVRCEVLMTARTSIGNPHEYAWAISPMGREDSETLLRSIIDFDVDPASILDAADGHPLALELLAGRLASLGPDDMDVRVECFDATGPGRHASLRRIVDEACRDVGADERSLFHVLTVFPDGFGIDGAEAMAHPDSDPIRALSRLVTAALVQEVAHRRFRILEPIRRIASETLRASDLRSLGEERLVNWAAAQTHSSARTFTVADSDEGSADRRNMEYALDLAIDRGDGDNATKIAGALFPSWQVRSAEHGYQRAHAVLELHIKDELNRARCELVAGQLAIQVDMNAAVPLLRKSFQTLSTLRRSRSAALAAHNIATATHDLDDCQLAIDLADSCRAAELMGWSRINLAISMIDERVADAEIFDVLDEATRLGQRLAAPRVIAGAAKVRGIHLGHIGAPLPAVLEELDEAARVFRAHGDFWMLFDCVAGRSYVHLRDGDAEGARNSLTEELALCTAVIDDHIDLCHALVDVSWFLTVTGSLVRAIEIVELLAGRPDELAWLRRQRMVSATVEALFSELSSPRERTAVSDLYRVAELALGDLGRTGAMSTSNEGSA